MHWFSLFWSFWKPYEPNQKIKGGAYEFFNFWHICSNFRTPYPPPCHVHMVYEWPLSEHPFTTVLYEYILNGVGNSTYVIRIYIAHVNIFDNLATILQQSRNNLAIRAYHTWNFFNNLATISQWYRNNLSMNNLGTIFLDVLGRRL